MPVVIDAQQSRGRDPCFSFGQAGDAIKRLCDRPFLLCDGPGYGGLAYLEEFGYHPLGPVVLEIHQCGFQRFR